MKNLQNTTPRQFLLNTVFYIFLIVIAAYMLWGASQDKYQADARVYYVAGGLIRHGNIDKIYNFQYQNELLQKLVEHKEATILFINTPVSAVIFAPLTFLSFYHFYVLLIILNTLLIGFTVFLFCRKLEINNAVTGALTFFVPAASAIFHSQLTALVLLLYVLALINIKKPFVSGLFAGLLFFKPQHLLFAPFLFFINKSWKSRTRFLFGFMLSLLMLFSANFLIYGPSVYKDYFHFMQSRNKILVQNEAYQGYNLYSASAALDPILGYSKSFIVISVIEAGLYIIALALVDKSSSFYKSASAAVILTLALGVQTKYTDLLMLALPAILLLSLVPWPRPNNKIPILKLVEQIIIPLVILAIPILCFLQHYILGALLLVIYGFSLLVQKSV